jgi:hypothetical protein
LNKKEAGNWSINISVVSAFYCLNRENKTKKTCEIESELDNFSAI